MNSNTKSNFLCAPSPIFSPTKSEMLSVIKKRKNELLNEIKSLEDEINDISAQIENMDILEEGKTSSHAKKLAIGRKKFNMDPNKGISYMVEHEILKSNSEDIAYFLYHGEGLNKTAIGEYLGENNPFNIEVLNDFVKLHEFANMILVQALRQFLWSFRLPGEAQKIDRVMECFAKHYCNCNPGVFLHTDACFILSYSIIMLNTILHNPSVKEKPTLQRFLDMNKGIYAGQSLPDDLLTSLYNNIKKEPFKIPEDDGNDLMHTFFNPVKEGWLWKQGGRYKSWKRRWFVLADGCLYYFQFTTDKEPRGIIPLQNLKIRIVASSHNNNQNGISSGSGSLLLGGSKDKSRLIPSASNQSNSNNPLNHLQQQNTTTNAITIDSITNNNVGKTASQKSSNASLNTLPTNTTPSSAPNTSNVFEILPMIERDIIKACKKSDTDGGKVVEGKHCVYRMSAATAEEASAWVAALNSQTKFYLRHHPHHLSSSANANGGVGSSANIKDHGPISTSNQYSHSGSGDQNITGRSRSIIGLTRKQSSTSNKDAKPKNNELTTGLQTGSCSDSVKSDEAQNSSASHNVSIQDDLTRSTNIHLYRELLSLRRQYNG